MKVYFCLLFTCLFFINGQSQSTFQNDSLAIIKHCQQILQNPQNSDSLHSIIRDISKNNASLKLKDIYLYNYSKVLFQTGQTDSAYQTSLAGLTLYGNDSLAYKASKFHNIIAAVHAFNNEYPQGITEFTKALHILEHHNDEVKAALIKSNIANLFFSLSDYESAYNYSMEAVAILNKNNDTLNAPGITAIVAISAIKLGRIDEGAKLTIESIELSKRYNNPVGLIVSNLSKGEWQTLVGNYTAAKQAYLESLRYAEMYRQSHYILMDKIGLLKTEVLLKNYQSALKYGLEAMEESTKLANENTKYAILKNISYAYAGLQEFENAHQYIDSAHNLYKSTASTENKAKINELLIQYETEKKESELILSQLETVNQKVKIGRRNNWIIGLTATVLILLLFYWVYRKRQAQKILIMQQNAEKNTLLAAIDGEEKERERLANELHDGIASALTGIRLKLEQNELNGNKTEVIQHLKTLQEDTRRISHNLMPISLYNHSLEEALLKYAIENSTAQTKINVHKLNSDLIQIEPILKISIYRICQELIQNVLKHANSPTCTIQINQNISSIQINIEDEGSGFNYDEKNQSQGLSSINKRLLNLSGKMEVESKVNQGTLIMLTVKKAK